jgi:hypothetical protein
VIDAATSRALPTSVWMRMYAWTITDSRPPPSGSTVKLPYGAGRIPLSVVEEAAMGMVRYDRSGLPGLRAQRAVALLWLEARRAVAGRSGAGA